MVITTMTHARATHTASSRSRTKEIESVIHVQHNKTIDRIVFRIAAHHGIDASAEIALIVQDIVEL